MQRPIWVPKHFSCQENCIRLSGRNYLFGLDWLCDEADRPGRDACLFSDLGCEGDLEPRAGWNLCIWDKSTA